MANRSIRLAALCEMTAGQEADLFVLMTRKETLTTRDGKPYVRVGFRDAAREVVFPIWSDSPWADACRDDWSPGEFYKLRAIYRETNFGPQLEIQKIRGVVEADRRDGFDPTMLLPRSRFEPASMLEELKSLTTEHVADKPLRSLVLNILDQHRDALLELPAATRNHHAFAGGWLEHVLSVTQTCVYLADKYADQYPELEPPLDKGLIVAGGVLHDIGKLRELSWQPEGASYTAAGNLVGHIVQGRDIVREAATAVDLDPERLLRLEHIVLSHQRLAEWGSPKPPMTPEALIVHYADDVDAKLHMMVAAMRDDPGDGPFTSKKNALMQTIYRGGG